MNAFETDFKVGTKVKVYNPYGSFEYEDVVKSITPKGMYIKVGYTNYRPKIMLCVFQDGVKELLQ